jgi:helix-turn-helix protein
MSPRMYGIAEIADALGVPRNTVAQWRIRGKLPPATEYLRTGPVWDAKTIEPWIRERRKEEG